MVPPNHPWINRVFHYKPSILGVFPLFLETPISTVQFVDCNGTFRMKQLFSHFEVFFSGRPLYVVPRETWTLESFVRKSRIKMYPDDWLGTAMPRESSFEEDWVMILGYSACLFVPIEEDLLTSSCLFLLRISELTATTVDGGSPAPVEVGSLSHHLQGFIHPRWWDGFLNHQQHESAYAAHQQSLNSITCQVMSRSSCSVGCVFFLHQVARRTTLHQPSCGSGLGFLE